MKPLLQAEHVTICYPKKEVVKDLCFEVFSGEVLGIIGESGSGKSTIIKGIMGLLEPDGEIIQGRFLYQGKDLSLLTKKERRNYLGPELGMVFQDCKASLCPVRTVGAQIYDAVRAHKKCTRKEVQLQAWKMLKQTGFEDPKRIWKSYPFELSGGMNQRVGICMAMLLSPRLLLADEPTSALDQAVCRQVEEELLKAQKTYETGMLLVTHNMGEIGRMADRILVLRDGKTEEYGHKDEIFKNPKSAYTREFLSSTLQEI